MKWGRPEQASPFAFSYPRLIGLREGARRFDMLLYVRNAIPERLRLQKRFWLSSACLILLAAALAIYSRASTQTPTAAASQPSAQPTPQSAAATQSPANSSAPVPLTPQLAQQRSGLNIVVLDPAHGGTDTGARGTGGIRESELVMEMTLQVRRALELQGFQVVQTRQGNENPSFNDRSAVANAQVGAVFVTLHVSSTGLRSTARVYVHSDLPQGSDPSGLIPWDRAQSPFQSLSRKLGDTVQGNLAQRFKGSPPMAQTASVRQLRTTAAPAIAVEISSVSVDDRSELDRMLPGLAECIARGIAEFKPSYVVASTPGAQP
jgi:N-acetylmuramoyl-L-alanine amidase